MKIALIIFSTIIGSIFFLNFFGIFGIAIWGVFMLFIIGLIGYLKPNGKGLKILNILFSIITILIGLFGIGCGGFFSIGSFYDNYLGSVILIFSLPSLLIGLSCTFGGYKWFKKLINTNHHL